MGEQENPFPPTQCKPWHGGKKQGGEAIANSSGEQLRALEPGGPSSAMLHMGPVAAGQEPSKEQCGSGPEDAPALQALKPSPSQQCQHQEKPAAPQVPRGGLAVRQGVTLRWPMPHWEQEEHREKITYFSKEMCSKREAQRSCQREPWQR